MTMGAAADPTSRRTWAIDAARSEVTFTASLLRRLVVRGGFPAAVAGEITQAGETFSGAAIVAVTAIRTGIGRRDRHLRSAEFLDAARHDVIAVRVEGIMRRPGPQITTADITIKDVTTRVPVEVEFVSDDASLTAVVRGRLRRHDVRLVPSRIADLAIGEDIAFEARVVAGPG